VQRRRGRVSTEYARLHCWIICHHGPRLFFRINFQHDQAMTRFVSMQRSSCQKDDASFCQSFQVLEMLTDDGIFLKCTGE